MIWLHHANQKKKKKMFACLEKKVFKNIFERQKLVLLLF